MFNMLNIKLRNGDKIMGATQEVKIMACKCENAFQDEKYGKKMRVHNQCGKDTAKEWRCTVCTDVKRTEQKTKEKSKEKEKKD